MLCESALTRSCSRVLDPAWPEAIPFRGGGMTTKGESRGIGSLLRWNDVESEASLVPEYMDEEAGELKPKPTASWSWGPFLSWRGQGARFCNRVGAGGSLLHACSSLWRISVLNPGKSVATSPSIAPLSSHPRPRIIPGSMRPREGILEYKWILSLRQTIFINRI